MNMQDLGLIATADFYEMLNKEAMGRSLFPNMTGWGLEAGLAGSLLALLAAKGLVGLNEKKKTDNGYELEGHPVPNHLRK